MTSSTGGTYNEDAAVDLETFQQLLDKLESSKTASATPEIC